jgi:hypothetical protein
MDDELSDGPLTSESHVYAARLYACNHVAYKVEAGAGDGWMMRSEHSFERHDWSIVRLVFSVFPQTSYLANMGRSGPREITLLSFHLAYATLLNNSIYLYHAPTHPQLSSYVTAGYNRCPTET